MNLAERFIAARRRDEPREAINSKNSPDRFAAILRYWTFGRYTLALNRYYAGDQYGQFGSASLIYSLRFTVDPPDSGQQ